MSKSKTPSFILELKLNTTADNERILADRFFAAFLMQNRLIRFARKRLSALRQNDEYRKMLFEYISIKSKTDKVSKRRKSELGKLMGEIRKDYGLSEYQFHAWIVKQQHRYKRYIDSNTAQKIASSVWRAVENVLFRSGKTIHFKRLDDLLALTGKSNASGIRFKDGKLRWLGLIIQPQIRKGDWYAREALTHRVKYCGIKRRAMGTSYHYYLQLILEGKPPIKHKYTDGRVGIDLGISSEAVFSENGCILTELGEGSENIKKKVRKLQRKMERSRKVNNPDKYNDDGTIKRGARNWRLSKSYMRNQMRLKTLYRRNTESIKQKENILANEILMHHGSDIVVEKMDYKSLQKKKERRKTSNGRERSRRHFGISIAGHAPSRFLRLLEQKLNYIDKTIFYVDTWKFRASQYDHVLGDYLKCPVTQRTKMIGNYLVQRDLYSAFLLWSAIDKEAPDRDKCKENFQLFLKHQQTCINELLTKENTLKSFGLKDFKTKKAA